MSAGMRLSYRVLIGLVMLFHNQHIVVPEVCASQTTLNAWDGMRVLLRKSGNTI
jgi:hypothetical protein